MIMKYFSIFIVFLASAGKIESGNGCSACKYLVKNRDNRRQRRRIEQTINKMPLPVVGMLHLRTHTNDFNIDGALKEFLPYFRACLAKRYIANAEEINANIARSRVSPVSKSSQSQLIRVQPRLAHHHNREQTLPPVIIEELRKLALEINIPE